jgi:hypothetical protein
MDGRHVKQIVGTDITWPNGLTCDYDTRKLYWADTSLNKIESVQIDASSGNLIVVERLTIVSDDKYVSRPYGLTLNKQILYWTEVINGNIMKHDMETNQTLTCAKDFPQLFEVEVHTVSIQKKENSACVSFECSLMCLFTPGAGVCSCRNGFSLQLDGQSCSENATAILNPDCTETEFLCKGTTGSVCIHRDNLCDGTEDCSDGSDEAPDVCLKELSCSMNQFMCVDVHQCIEEDWLCDGDRDCMDGSDELKERCMNMTCQPDQHFKCVSDGACLPKEDECNGVADCDDGSDEHDSCFNVTCSTNQFKCDAYRCFPELYRCDGEIDCNDNSDELGCPGYCPEDFFLCSIDLTCIPANVTCNGKKV